MDGQPKQIRFRVSKWKHFRIAKLSEIWLVITQFVWETTLGKHWKRKKHSLFFIEEPKRINNESATKNSTQIKAWYRLHHTSLLAWQMPNARARYWIGSLLFSRINQYVWNRAYPTIVSDHPIGITIQVFVRMPSVHKNRLIFAHSTTILWVRSAELSHRAFQFYLLLN